MGHPVQTPTGQRETITLNVGPQHPSTHGVLRIVVELDGETVLHARPEIGYLHTGFEKNFEKLTYHQGITLTDRMDYLACISNNLGYCLAIEKLLDLEVPRRAQYLRVILTELTRVASHLVWLGTHAIELGAMSILLYCFRERGELLKIFELVSGQRMMTSYIRVGGVAVDAPLTFAKRVRQVLEMLPGRIDEYEELLTKNRIWMARTQGVGVLSTEDAILLSLSGPIARASGLNWDIRKAEPYSSYDKFDFVVPVRTEGDVYARYVVRIEEMRQSLRIVQQALDGLPDGPIKADAPHIVLPDREKMKTEMEALIYHFKIVTEGFAPPVGEIYQAIESPRGELGFYIVSDGTSHPWRVRVRGPSFMNVHALKKMVHNNLFSDMIAIVASADFVMGEVDR